MTTLIEPTRFIATATPAVRQPGQHSATVHTVPAFRRSQPADAPATTEQLLRQRHDLPADHPDRAKLRVRVIEENLPMAYRLARRYAGRGELFDDLAQVAALALIRAVDGYDPSRQTLFAGYAIPSIVGGLKRHFRDTAWGMRVPRSTQELAREVVIATGELGQQRGHTPTSAELADHLHRDLDDILAAVGASQEAYHLVSLNVPYPGTNGADRIDLIGGSDPRFARVDDQVALRLLLAALPLRERRILAMRFFGQLTQAQIAAEVGVSQMQVSRLLKQSLARLRATMPD